jgi:hypothetical protein
VRPHQLLEQVYALRAALEYVTENAVSPHVRKVAERMLEVWTEPPPPPVVGYGSGRGAIVGPSVPPRRRHDDRRRERTVERQHGHRTTHTSSASRVAAYASVHASRTPSLIVPHAPHRSDEGHAANVAGAGSTSWTMSATTRASGARPHDGEPMGTCDAPTPGARST